MYPVVRCESNPGGTKMKRTLNTIIAISAMMLFGGVTVANGQGVDADAVQMPFENGAFALDNNGLDPKGLFAQVSGLCSELGGKASYVIPVKNGRHTRLTEVGHSEAAAYVNGTTADNSWIMACEGAKRFVVEKSYASLTKGVQTAIFNSNRGLEGVDYVKGTSHVATAAAPASAEPADRALFIEQLAWEVSTLKMGFVRPQGETRFTGIYSGTLNGSCEMVSVKEEGRGEESRLEGAIHDFKVCGTYVASLGTRGIKAERMYAKASM